MFCLEQGPSVLHITEGNWSAFYKEFNFLQFHSVGHRNFHYFILHILLQLLVCMLKISLFLEGYSPTTDSYGLLRQTGRLDHHLSRSKNKTVQTAESCC